MADYKSINPTAQHCAGCAYWRLMFYFGGTRENRTRACHYLLDTGKMRGGTAQDCTQKILVGGIAR